IENREGARAEAIKAAALSSLIVQSIAFITALLVAGAALRAVRVRLVRPVGALMQAIQRIGQRDYQTPVPQFAHADEFGAMAAALEGLRESAATAEQLARERELDQGKRLERSQAIDSACRSFDDTVQAVIVSMSTSTGQLDTSASDVRKLVDESTDQTAAVASAAETATTNLETIAAATEELTASVSEIAAQVQASAAEARQAVEKAAEVSPAAIREAVKGQEFDAPNGHVKIEAENLHTYLTPRIAQWLPDGQGKIIDAYKEPVMPLPYVAYGETPTNLFCTGKGLDAAKLKT
ncbi:MAG: transporter substrate-binding protein, partial [Bradyrhizobium sp.]|nr:transporter substrate-binding protein [Bradyrhizobium sp.]